MKDFMKGKWEAAMVVGDWKVMLQECPYPPGYGKSDPDASTDMFGPKKGMKEVELSEVTSRLFRLNGPEQLLGRAPVLASHDIHMFQLETAHCKVDLLASSRVHLRCLCALNAPGCICLRCVSSTSLTLLAGKLPSATGRGPPRCE